ncbi:MAG: hypothetical protein QXJ17_02510 [Nitrososphaeria archaeon]
MCVNDPAVSCFIEAGLIRKKDFWGTWKTYFYYSYLNSGNPSENIKDETDTTIFHNVEITKISATQWKVNFDWGAKIYYVTFSRDWSGQQCYSQFEAKETNFRYIPDMAMLFEGKDLIYYESGGWHVFQNNNCFNHNFEYDVKYTWGSQQNYWMAWEDR